MSLASERKRARAFRAATLRGKGYTRGQIAAALGVSERTVSEYFRDEHVRAVARQIREQSDPSAVDVLRELLHSGDQRVRLGAAIALLKAPGAGGDAYQGEYAQVVELRVHRTSDGDEELTIVEGDGEGEGFIQQRANFPPPRPPTP